MSGCGVADAAATHSPSPYLPVHVVAAKTIPVSPLRSHRWQTLKGTPLGATVESATPQALLLAVFPTNTTRTWPTGLYDVRATTGRATRVADLEADAAALNGSWLVYEPVLNPLTKTQSVLARNLKTGDTWPVMRFSAQQTGAGNVKGLTIEGHQAYWLSNVMGPDGMTSTVYDYNLATRHLDVLLRASTRGTNRMFFALTSDETGLWVSVNNSGNLSLNTVSGSLWHWSFARHRVTMRVPVPHAPSTLDGASDGAVLFSADYQERPPSPFNPAPYPVYLALPDRHTVLKLTSRVNPGGSASIEGSSVVVDGMGLQSRLLNWETGVEVSLPVPSAEVCGGWLIEHRAHRLLWTRLNPAAGGPKPSVARG